MRRKHLMKPEFRVDGACQQSLWGPFCSICTDKGYAKLNNPTLRKAISEQLNKVWTPEEITAMKKESDQRLEKRLAPYQSSTVPKKIY